MSDHASFVQAILANPADDMSRLVYADFLEDTAEPRQPERAEFIRVQIELAKVPAEPQQRPMCRLIGVASKRGESAVHLRKCAWCKWAMEWGNKPAVWRKRELELFGTNEVRRPFGGFTEFVHELNRSASSQVRLPYDWDSHPANYLSGTVRRGFVAEVRCHLADWIGGECGRCYVDSELRPVGCNACSATGRTTGIGGRVVAEHPVEAVWVTDRDPLPVANGSEWWWHCVNEFDGSDEVRQPAHHLPGDVFDLLDAECEYIDSDMCIPYKRFPTRQSAHDSASAALIKLAHQRRAEFTCTGAG